MSETATERSAPAPLHFELEVNGERRSVPPECTVRELLQRLELDGRHLAVAVNRDVVPRSEFATRRLAAGDHVEVLEAVGGG